MIQFGGHAGGKLTLTAKWRWSVCLTTALNYISLSLSFCFYPTTGNQILSLGSLSKDQIYPMKLKGISICYSALKSALCGNYVSFGVFKLYGDNHFDSVLQAFVKMLLSVSHSDLLVSLLCPGCLHGKPEYQNPSLELLETWGIQTPPHSMFQDSMLAPDLTNLDSPSAYLYNSTHRLECHSCHF